MKVAVTTSEDRFASVAEQLDRRGMRPVPLPCIRVESAGEESLAEIRCRGGEVDRIFVTSARTVDIVWGGSAPSDVPFLSVGASTSAAIRAAGGTVETEGDEGGERLAVTVDTAGLSVLYPRAESADPAISAALHTTASSVVERIAYRTCSTTPGSDPVDAVIFGSPSAVHGWCRSRTLTGLLIVAIGPTTAAAVGAYGADVDAVPDRPGFEAAAESVRTLSSRGRFT